MREDLAGLKASLAERAHHSRAAAWIIRRFWAALSFLPEKTADGRNVLHVHSPNVVNEPFATLLVEVDWARGHLVREYTVLLDPPVFSAESARKAGVAAPSAGGSARSGSRRAPRRAGGSRRRRGHAAAASAPASRAPPAPSTEGHIGAAQCRAGQKRRTRAAGSRYTVRRGDTLSAVASQSYPGADRRARERELVAIYRGNPDGLRRQHERAARRQPSRPARRRRGRGDQSRRGLGEVRRQYASWNAAHGAAAPAAHAQRRPAAADSCAW